MEIRPTQSSVPKELFRLPLVHLSIESDPGQPNKSHHQTRLIVATMDDPYEDRVMPVEQTIPARPLEAGLMSDQGSFQPPVADFYSILNVSRTVSRLCHSSGPNAHDCNRLPQ